MPASGDITALLVAASDGDRAALDALFPVLYDELHRLAGAQRRRRQADYTVNTTALVHEAYLKLVRQEQVSWKNRGHFFALAAKAMRQILLDYARKRQAAKRGGDADRVSLDAAPEVANPVPAESADELVALDEALKKLERISERQSRVVECRFFAGLPVEETAEALGISEATVKRDWRLASAWLRREIGARLDA